MFSDPDGEFFKIPMWGLTYMGDLISNLINGIDNPFGNAWNNANNIVNGMEQCCQFTTPIGDNAYFNIGLSPFSVSVYAGVSYYNGGNITNIGVGYGVYGLYGYANQTITINGFSLTLGVGKGSGFSGWNVVGKYKGYGIGYGRTTYGSSIGPDGMDNSQITGTVGLYFKNGSFRLENDYFGDRGDRWRTNAWELNIGDFSLGSSIYTNDPEGMGYGHPNDRPSPLWGFNRLGKDGYNYGAWDPGYVYSCPLWIGWRSGNNVSRIGYKYWAFQDATQNFVHKYCNFGRMNFYLNYEHFDTGPYFYGGFFNPFSLY